MPQTPLKNLIYRMMIPFLAPTPHKRMSHDSVGVALNHLPYYEHLLVKHRVQGASLFLSDGDHTAQVFTSLRVKGHIAAKDTMFRVASITKMATALVVLTCIDDGLFALDTPVRQLLPETDHGRVLDGITVRHLLCHTSGLRDIPAVDIALRDGLTYDHVLACNEAKPGTPGADMVYCNFGFGLLGCILENVTGRCIAELFKERLFAPLEMRAVLDASTLDESCIMPITRVLPYKPGTDVTITPLGRIPLVKADPLRHFGHTAGAMYTDASSLSHLLDVLAYGGEFKGQQIVSKEMMNEMIRTQSSTPTRTYGLGLVLLQRDFISERRLLGHQGFAYGCVDGAFVEEGTGRKVVFLNGGASEARKGKLGLVNQDVLKWALRKELPSWM